MFCADTLDWLSLFFLSVIKTKSRCAEEHLIVAAAYVVVIMRWRDTSADLILIVSLAGFIQVIKGKQNLM